MCKRTTFTILIGIFIDEQGFNDFAFPDDTKEAQTTVARLFRSFVKGVFPQPDNCETIITCAFPFFWPTQDFHTSNLDKNAISALKNFVNFAMDDSGKLGKSATSFGVSIISDAVEWQKEKSDRKILETNQQEAWLQILPQALNKKISNWLESEVFERVDSIVNPKSDSGKKRHNVRLNFKYYVVGGGLGGLGALMARSTLGVFDGDKVKGWSVSNSSKKTESILDGQEESITTYHELRMLLISPRKPTASSLEWQPHCIRKFSSFALEKIDIVLPMHRYYWQHKESSQWETSYKGWIRLKGPDICGSNISISERWLAGSHGDILGKTTIVRSIDDNWVQSNSRKGTVTGLAGVNILSLAAAEWCRKLVYGQTDSGDQSSSRNPFARKIKREIPGRDDDAHSSNEEFELLLPIIGTINHKSTTLNKNATWSAFHTKHFVRIEPCYKPTYKFLPIPTADPLYALTDPQIELADFKAYYTINGFIPTWVKADGSSSWEASDDSPESLPTHNVEHYHWIKLQP